MTDGPRTSLYDRHAAAGARFGAFAGWQMPLHYGSPRTEHMAVREACGIFDVSHMGQIEVTGPGARELLSWALTNDLGEVGPGQAQYTLMLDDDGGVIDDLIVYGLLDRFLLVVNAANVAACLARLMERSGPEADVADRSREIAMLALQGPAWKDGLASLVSTPGPLNLEYFEVTEDGICGAPAFIARTGYTGEPGVEILCPWGQAPRVWDALTSGEHPATPAGLVARDTLRTEMGYPLYGQELSRDRTPIEAALTWACDVADGAFAGCETLRRQAADGTPEKLCAFTLTEPGIPRAGAAVIADGRTIGTVTSGTLSPVLDRGIGMAYVERAWTEPGREVAIDIRGTHKAARIARRPLVDSSPKKG